MHDSRKHRKALAASIGVFVVMFFMSMNHGPAFAFLYGMVPAVCSFALLIARRITPLRRAIYFIFTFVLWFGFDLIALHERGSLILPTDPRISGTVIMPCPATIPMIFFGWMIHGQEVFVPSFKVIFPTTYSLFLVVFGLMLFQGIIVGRGYCGWSCLFGGFIEATASGRPYGKSVKWRLERFMKSDKSKASEKGGVNLKGLFGIREEVRDIKWGFLLAIGLISTIALRPIFCEICPSRVWNDYPNPASGAYFWWSISAIVGLFAVFWLILPLLTRKKLWCNAICPLGAFVGVFGVLSPFQTKIDKEKCNECMLCARVCKDYAITADRVKGSGKAAFECAKCGRCIDSCAQGAVDIYLRGTSKKVRSWFIPINLVFTFTWLSVFVWAILTMLPAMLGF